MHAYIHTYRPKAYIYILLFKTLSPKETYIALKVFFNFKFITTKIDCTPNTEMTQNKSEWSSDICRRHANKLNVLAKM